MKLELVMIGYRRGGSVLYDVKVSDEEGLCKQVNQVWAPCAMRLLMDFRGMTAAEAFAELVRVEKDFNCTEQPVF
jgi:hypothetical protein